MQIDFFIELNVSENTKRDTHKTRKPLFPNLKHQNTSILVLIPPDIVLRPPVFIRPRDTVILVLSSQDTMILVVILQNTSVFVAIPRKFHLSTCFRKPSAEKRP